MKFEQAKQITERPYLGFRVVFTNPETGVEDFFPELDEVAISSEYKAWNMAKKFCSATGNSVEVVREDFSKLPNRSERTIIVAYANKDLESANNERELTCKA